MSDSEFTWPVRVYYEDTDAGGVVYYANYLKFMERARTEWLRRMGFEQDQLISEQQTIFAVRKISVDYLKPARFNDQLEVCVRLAGSSGASIFLTQSVANRSGEEICVGEITVACLDSGSLRPKRLPQSILVELQNAD